MTEPTDSPFSNQSPLGGEPLSTVKAHAPGEVPALVAAAAKAQVAWSEKTIDERRDALSKLGPKLLRAAEQIAALIHRETGKPEVEALLGEVLASADVVSYWCSESLDIFEPEQLELDPIAYPKKEAFVHRVPRGVVAVIMPWNFPLALPLRAILPALISGNAVVFKPSEVTPRTGEQIGALLKDLLPEGLFQVVQGGRDVGASVVAADVDAVVFTGSPVAGRKVAAACAERLIPCALELGGKDAAIVLEDANLERTANGLVWAANMNAGQNCGGVERVYVVKAVAEELTAKIVAATKALEKNRDVGPLTTRAQYNVVARQLQQAKDAEAKFLTGDVPSDDAGSYVAPVVLSVASDEGLIMTDETFGPVLPIRVVKDEDEAVELANASKYGLTASVWTKKPARGERLAKRLRAGVVTINNHSFTGAIPQAPWTGVGESGSGITGSIHSLDIHTRPKLILVDENSAKRELYWYPYTPVLKTVALALILVRGGAKSIGARIGAIFTLLSALPKRLFGG